jgi:CRP/FNR family cyclic AMP-dependent transcriptional regulator
MISLEKLLILKSVTLFKQVPDDLLLSMVTSIVNEKLIPADELILKKNEVNSTMYIIVAGKVKVHNEIITITELGEREIFGELSALTHKPTVSSVSSLTECLLLTIHSNDLYELMNFEVGLAKGIVQALCQRTQSVTLQIQELLHTRS